MGDILYIGKFIGFAGGIERYIWNTANLFDHIDYAGMLPASGEEKFRSAFRHVYDCTEELPEHYSIAVIHKILPLEIMTKLHARFGRRLVFMVHDHDLYCPRRHYYTPFCRKNCHESYSPWRCTLCGMASRRCNGVLGGGAVLELVKKMHTAVLSDFMRGNLLKNGFAPESIHKLTPVCEAGLPRGDFMPSGVLRLLFLGQLIRGKGCDLLLEALRLIPHVPWSLTVAGDGKDRCMLESMVKNYGMTGRVKFAGWSDSPEKFFRHTDLAVFPSRWQEPFGLSGLEALAHGVPVAGFSAGGTGEWLIDGVTGFALPEGDVRSLAEAIRTCRASELAAMSGKCTDFVRRNFSAGVFLRNFVKLREVVK